MIPQRFAASQSKSRIGDARPSMLPKPRRPVSTDRLSTEPRRPSTTGQRSSSAEPSRGTFGGGREASATKLPINSRSRSQQGDRFGQSSMTPLRSSLYSRSQQGDRFGQSSMTPLRSSQYASRPTITPQRTPSDDCKSRNWQTSLDRALAFVTIKDRRATSNVAWQRAEIARVQEALAARGASSNMALVRPLTIARFVDIVGALLSAIIRDAKLNKDNYVAKLPHLSKRLLYPGPVSKSWLKTVNTLHAFPHALALIAYLLDLANHIETPVCDQSLYVEKDEFTCLRREYLNRCWIRFQDPRHQFEDLQEEYLQGLQALLGNDEERIAELHRSIKEYETRLEDETEQDARAEEARLLERRDALLAALRDERAERRRTRAAIDEQRGRRDALAQAAAHLDEEIDRANSENQQLKRELEEQSMSVEERTRLLEEVDYSVRVQDSKTALATQIAKMVLSKETELALWQKKTLDSCMEYKQGLIHLSAQFPDLAALAIDEKELMGSECANYVSAATAALRDVASGLQEARASHARSKGALARKRAALLDETRTKITDMKAAIKREQQSLDAESGREASEAAAWSAQLAEIRDKLDALAVKQRSYATVDQQLELWEKQEQEWRSKLAAMREYIESQRTEAARLLEAACARRVQLVMDTVSSLNEQLDKC